MDDQSIWNNATVSALLGGLSGGIVSWLVAARGERSTRLFSCYQSVETVLDELMYAACSYWRQRGKIEAAESQIKMLFDRLDVKLDAYSRVLKKEVVARNAQLIFDDLFDDVTGDGFEGVNRKPERLRVRHIREKCIALKDLLHKF